MQLVAQGLTSARVAERLVIFDYPAASSVAFFESMSRRAVYAMGVRTEAYRVISDRAIRQALDRSGFRVRSVHRQFVLPITFHRIIGSRRFTLTLEDFLGLPNPPLKLASKGSGNGQFSGLVITGEHPLTQLPEHLA